MKLNVGGINIYTRTYVKTDSDQMGQIYLGQEELKVRSTHRVQGRCDCTSARYQWEENWSNRTTGYRSSGKRDANKNMGRKGIHEGKSNYNEPQIGCRQQRSNLRGRKDTNNGPSHGRTQSLDELPGG